MFVAELFESAIQKTLVIMPGGFHPFHPGHLSLYRAAQQAFPGADVYVAATNDTSERPFPFDVKKQLAELAGVQPGHFVQVKSPFQAKEIVSQYDPETTALVFVRSEKDANTPPHAGGVKKDGSPSYLQPYAKKMQPMSKHGYMSYLPTVEFKAGASGITSATQIRQLWPTATPEQKQQIAADLYPTAKNPQVIAKVVALLDSALGNLEEGWKEKAAAVGMAAALALGGPTAALAQENTGVLTQLLGAGLIALKTANNIKNYTAADAQAELKQELTNVAYGRSNNSELAQWAAQQKAQAERAEQMRQGGELRPFGQKPIEFNEEAAGVGVIANKKQAKDPRYSMSLTKDVRPGQIQKSLKAFNLAEKATKNG